VNLYKKGKGWPKRTAGRKKKVIGTGQEKKTDVQEHYSKHTKEEENE
jgi:hypothetical protein